MRTTVCCAITAASLIWLGSGLVRAVCASDKTAGEKVFLKENGDRWVKVVRRRGVILSQTLMDQTAADAAIPPAASTASPGGLFRPYVTFPVGSWPEAVAIGDLNGDGRSDVALVTSYYFDPANDHSLHVFLQDGSGGFSPRVKYPVGGSPETVDVGDVNGDGRDDVVVGRGDAILVLLQNASGTLDAGISYPTTSSYKIRIGDFNSDGRLDVAGIDWSQSIDVFLQQPNGTLALGASYVGTHAGYDDLEVGDLNHDRRDDLVIMSGQLYASPNVSLLLQKPEGLFDAPVVYDLGGNELTSGVGVGDANGDGLDDLAASYGGNSPDAHVAIWTQNAAGTLDSPVRLASYDVPEPVTVADVSSDGRPDVVVAHGGWLELGVYVQRADGSLGWEDLYPVPYATHYNPHGLAVGDVDGDGADDVVIADYNSGLVVLYRSPAAAPLPPTGLAAAPGAGEVSLYWSASAGADSYSVRRSGASGGPYEIVASGLIQTSYTDKDVVNGATYYYVVTAVNGVGESAYSSEVVARPVRPAPGPPTGLEAFVLGRWLVLYWNPVTDASSYSVKRAQSHGGPYQEIGQGVTRTLYFYVPPRGRVYYYVVAAVNESGEGPPSQEVVVEPKKR
jgi:hypothetical protein